MSLTSTAVTLDPPRVGLQVDDAAHDFVDPLPLGEQFVQLRLSHHAAQRGLGDLAGGEVVVLDLDHGLRGVHHAEIHHRVDCHAHVVLGDRVLGRDVQRDDAQVHAAHALDAVGHEEDQAGPLRPGQLAEAKDHAPFVLPQDAQ